MNKIMSKASRKNHQSVGLQVSGRPIYEFNEGEPAFDDRMGTTTT